MLFQNRVVLITGASGGLGGQVVRAFLQHGARIVAVGSPRSRPEDLQQQLGVKSDRLEWELADVTKEESVQGLVSRVIAKTDRIDVLLQLAGGYAGGEHVAHTTLASWNRMIDLNLKSAFLCCRAVLPQMLTQNYGRIVCISSRGAVEVSAGAAAYAVSKAAVLTLVQTIAEESKGTGITANAVVPGMIDTPANRHAMPDADFSKWVKPESIAELLLYLTSEQAGAVTGAAVPIYGTA